MLDGMIQLLEAIVAFEELGDIDLDGMGIDLTDLFTFTVDKDEKIISHVKRKVFSLHDSYSLDSPYGKILFKGNILGYDYHIYLNDEEVGHVGRHFSLRDSFVLDLKDGLDKEFFVALLIAMDNITDEMNENASSS